MKYRDLFLCNACEQYRWPTIGATAKLSNSGAEKSSAKKAPTKGRAHAVCTCNNSGNNGHNDEVTQEF